MRYIAPMLFYVAQYLVWSTRMSDDFFSRNEYNSTSQSECRGSRHSPSFGDLFNAQEPGGDSGFFILVSSSIWLFWLAFRDAGFVSFGQYLFVTYLISIACNCIDYRILRNLDLALPSIWYVLFTPFYVFLRSRNLAMSESNKNRKFIVWLFCTVWSLTHV